MEEFIKKVKKSAEEKDYSKFFELSMKITELNDEQIETLFKKINFDLIFKDILDLKDEKVLEEFFIFIVDFPFLFAFPESFVGTIVEYSNNQEYKINCLDLLCSFFNDFDVEIDILEIITERLEKNLIEDKNSLTVIFNTINSDRIGFNSKAKFFKRIVEVSCKTSTKAVLNTLSLLEAIFPKNRKFYEMFDEKFVVEEENLSIKEELNLLRKSVLVVREKVEDLLKTKQKKHKELTFLDFDLVVESSYKKLKDKF